MSVVPPQPPPPPPLLPSTASAPKLPLPSVASLRHCSPVTALAVTPPAAAAAAAVAAGTFLVTGCRDNSLYFWDLTTSSTATTSAQVDPQVTPKLVCRSKLHIPPLQVCSVAVTVDGKYALSGGRDGVIYGQKLFPPKPGEKVREYRRHFKGYITALAVFPDNWHFAVGDSGGWVTIVNFKGHVHKQFRSAHSQPVTCLAITCSIPTATTATVGEQRKDGLVGTYVLSGGEDFVVNLWQPVNPPALLSSREAGKLLRSITFHSDVITSVTFLPFPTPLPTTTTTTTTLRRLYAVTTSYDKTACVWDLFLDIRSSKQGSTRQNYKRPLHILSHPSSVLSSATASAVLITSTSAGEVFAWNALEGICLAIFQLSSPPFPAGGGIRLLATIAGGNLLVGSVMAAGSTTTAEGEVQVWRIPTIPLLQKSKVEGLVEANVNRVGEKKVKKASKRSQRSAALTGGLPLSQEEEEVEVEDDEGSSGGGGSEQDEELLATDRQQQAQQQQPKRKRKEETTTTTTKKKTMSKT